jgi:hypothetical protein
LTADAEIMYRHKGSIGNFGENAESARNSETTINQNQVSIET